MNRKLETKRLFIYLLLSFALAWAVFFTYILTGHKWDGENPGLESFTALGMLTPVIAHILTRWLTGEGFSLAGEGSMMLGISFRDKKWIFFVFAMFVPWLYFELGYALTLLALPGAFDPEYYKTLGLEKDIIFCLPVISIISATLVSFAAFGEEAGWRGYMMPKLIRLAGMKKAVLAGGIIWGLWHAPLTCAGHNFGTDYPGFPYLGIVIMCVECTFLGMMLTYLTVKSGSIWPAAIMHAVNNTNPSILKCFVNTEKAAELLPNPVWGWFFLLIPDILIGSVCLALMGICKDS